MSRRSSLRPQSPVVLTEATRDEERRKPLQEMEIWAKSSTDLKYRQTESTSITAEFILNMRLESAAASFGGPIFDNTLSSFP